MNIQICDTKYTKYVRTVDPVSPDDRVKTLRKAESALSGFDEAEAAQVIAKRQKAEVSGLSTIDDDGLSGDRSGRSPNDQRSDTMNPNNPTYHAATDNRSNQMNPNNPAYHSSRGHARR